MATNKKGYMKEYYHKVKTELIEELGGACKVCGASEELHFHHKEQLNGNRPRGSLNRLVEIKNNIENIELLCVPCHKEQHRGRKYV